MKYGGDNGKENWITKNDSVSGNRGLGRDCPGGLWSPGGAGVYGWHVEGDWLEWDYNIVNAAGHDVATVSKEIWNWTDTYTIDVYDPNDSLYALMLVLAIDAEKCSRN